MLQSLSTSSSRISMDWQVGDSRSIVHQFTHEEVETFARLTGDVNPLHVDSGFAKRTPAGGQVVHGMLAASYVSTLIGMHIPGPGALWQSFQVNWRKMIRIGDVIQFEVKVVEVHQALSTLALDIVGRHAISSEKYLDGRATVMILQQEQEIEASKVNLEGKRILVTGASGELGGAICKRLSASAARLVMWGRDSERLSSMASKFHSSVDSHHLIDLLDPKAIEAGLGQAMEKGSIYGVVHVAAPPLSYVPVDDANNQKLLQDQWNVNVAAFNQIVQRVLPTMENGGSIIHILTQYVLDAPPPKLSAYVSAKMAAWALIKAMAVELGPKGIRCNAISPGMMNSPYSKDVPVRTKQVEAASNPLRRLCKAEDVAEAVAFLCGPEARFINGVNLPVTGGARMP